MRVPTRWAFLSLLIVVCVSAKEDVAFISAMKNLIWGQASAENATHAADPKYFRQYAQARAASSVSSGSTCSLPQQIGTGPYRIPRWYYNPARQRCELFYWSGCCGNGNNFQTFQSCQQVCEVGGATWAPPSIQWKPSYSQITEITVEVSTSCGCPLPMPTTYATVAPQPRAACTCCVQPFSYGNGELAVPRYYYEIGENRCKEFLYRGQGGFGNVFESRDQCEQLCSPMAPMPPSSAEAVDPCEQDSESGVGSLQLQRFFFNKNTKLCEQFVYFGSGGNRNNFETLHECQAQCPESPNPCAVQTTGPLVQCAAGQSSCGNGYYCHVGNNGQTTTCCPKPSPMDRCQQPLNIGIGNANLQRWYFNPLSQQCQQCTYKGLQGNENNFISRQECENSCLVNPCRIGTPYRSSGVTVQCSALNPNVCPAGHYCHVGANQATSVCCQALGSSPCQETMDKGEGRDSLTRFYYDAHQRKCLTFNYLGAKGNTNNFLSMEQCEARCPVWTNPCAIGIPILGMDQKPLKCNHASTCANGYFCHLGFDEASTVCCPSQGDPCVVSVSEGTGSHGIQRWFYNSNTRQCQPFTYRGEGGNENNFLLREHCESTCPVWVNPCAEGEPVLRNNRPVMCSVHQDDSCPLTHWCHPGPDASTTVCCPGRVDPCIQVKTEGDGPLNLQRYYFNAVDRTCQPFIFKGLRGNGNNFLAQSDCEARCPVQVDPCPITFSSLQHSVKLSPCSASYSCPEQQWCHVGATKETTVCCPNAVADPCKAPPRNPGVGEFKTTRWAFDSTSRKCVPFEYRGMKGNANNFVNRENCETKCPVFVNPCKVGEPFQSAGRYQVCNPASPCPSQHYCHIGEASNYCCPMLGGDPCGQPMDRGVGNAQLQRWYWNVNQQCCLPFSYCGMKGTQNNFLSRTDCERTCYEMDNPCAGGEPLMGTNNRPLQCSQQTIATCGNAHWCHFGASQATTVCCPQRVDGEAICRLPQVEGEGDDVLDRFYYDINTRQCIPFVYKGRMGNQNNFLTKEACEQLCPAFVNVCPAGSPLLDSTHRPVPCTFGSDSCGDSHWCHLGLVPDEYQCCPGIPTNPGACQGGPYVEGEPSDKAPPAQRWWYNSETMQCDQFTFDGRKGSQNNFLTQEDCEATCPVFENPCNQPIPLPATMCSPNTNSCGPSMWCHVGATQESTVCCPSEGDPCSLPLSPGSGTSSIARWYYNQMTMNCDQFTYTGLRGNQNNFLTREACEERCGPNPCFEGRPFTGVDGRPQTCTSTASLNTCPANHWCHIGADASLTVCCPGASTNVCNMPMSTGEGNYNLDRYYYDSNARTCRPFTYNGLKGNQNNFLSLRSCQLSCQPLDNPCIGQPATTAAGQVIFCSSTNKDACPVNFWCHIGASPETTVCCPGPTNPCSVPLAPGTGNSQLGRYYYNVDDRVCSPFTYNGKRGNQNNFETQSECDRTCPVFRDPCIGAAALNADESPVHCDPMVAQQASNCPRGYFCLAGDHSTNNSAVCCPASSPDPCVVFLSEGAGNDSLPRFFYSPNEGACFPFDYRGEKGNQNNFVTKKLCEDTCSPVSHVCFGGDVPLTEEGRIIQCGNGSNCRDGYYCHIGENTRSTICCPDRGDPCEQQLMLGIGETNIPRYFYDSVVDLCRPFNYTGLGGNQNNFLSKQHCETTCPGFRGFCPHGRPHATRLSNGASSQVVTSCGVDIGCPQGHVCHVAKRTAKSVCCPDPALFCILPVDPGNCFTNETRYTYNREKGLCEKFEYSGCGGNLNNFDSLESCTEICCDKGYMHKYH